MLIPRKVKFRKQHHPRRTGVAKGGTRLAFGDYGIQSMEAAYLTNRQIESARIAMTRHIKRGGGSPTSSPAGCWSSYPELPRRSPARRCGWPSTSCR